MKTLTPEQKLEVVREAKRSFLAGKYNYLCPCLMELIHRLYDSFPFIYELPSILPELYEYKPSHVHPYDPWWPDGVTEPRLAVLDNLEARYYAQTNWWSRMWFKIRNIRIWKS